MSPKSRRVIIALVLRFRLRGIKLFAKGMENMDLYIFIGYLSRNVLKRTKFNFSSYLR